MAQDPQTLVEASQEPLRFSNPILAEMAEAEFQQWRHNPITQAFLLFLAHRAQALSKEALDFYLGDRVAEADKAGLRGRVLELEGLCAVKLSNIHYFYGVIPEEKQERYAAKNP